MGMYSSPQAPAADPNIGAAAAANAAVAADALNFNKQVYADNKPHEDAMYALAEQVGQDQLSISKTNQSRADEQWDRFQTLFAPVEEQTIADATNIDSAGELSRAAGDASSSVQRQFDNAAGQRGRTQAAMGVNPNSGRAMALDSESQLGLAASKAGAATGARLQARDRGIALRAGVANFGRNMPNTAANAYGIAVNSGNSAVGNNGAAMTAANNNAAQMNSGYNTSIAGNNSAGSILNTQYGNQVSLYGAQADYQAGMIKAGTQVIGSVAGAMSSKDFKEDKSSVDDGDTLKKVKGMSVESWKYKKGIADEGEHVGPYAEDVHKSFGSKAAPGGKAIDLISMNGIALSAVKGLAKQVDKLDGKVSKLVASRGLGRA